MREWVVPECLHVPIVAADEEAITDHIGDIVEILSPGRALIVAIDPPPERDNRLPIWAEPKASVFFERLQVWVSPHVSAGVCPSQGARISGGQSLGTRL
jgi:hypothetical protein